MLELWYWRCTISFDASEPARIHNKINTLEARMTIVMDLMKKVIKEKDI